MSYTPAAILAGLKAKDARIFNHLHQTYGQKIVAYVCRNSGSAEDGQEIAQVVWLRFWMLVNEDKYVETGKMSAFIWQIVVNAWHEELRRRKKHGTAAIDDSFHDPIAPDDEADIAALIVKDKYLQAMHEALNQMQEPCQSIIRLYHLQKIRLQEVAEQLAYDYNNLRKRIFDCRNKLRRMVEQTVDTQP